MRAMGVTVRHCGSAWVLLLAGCARHPAQVMIPPRPSDENRRGAVAYRFLPDPHASISLSTGGRQFVAPRPRNEFPLPRYPGTALAAGAGQAHVVVRIVIDTAGRVADVNDSPLEGSSRGPFADRFRDAVLRSLRHWRFTPGYIQQVEAGRSDYQELTRIDPVRVFYDVRFDFEIVGGEGRVRTSATPP